MGAMRRLLDVARAFFQSGEEKENKKKYGEEKKKRKKVAVPLTDLYRP